LEAFSDYLRGNLDSLTKEELIPFTRELEYTRSYLELERIAGRNIEVEYRLKAADFMLPPLVLQPIVENAVQHGAGNRTEKTLITIATCDMEGTVCIKVTDRPARMDAGSLTAVKEKDDGVGGLQSDRVSEAHKSATNTKKKSIGLDNVRARLDIQCGGTLKIRTIGETTEATMLIPEAQHIV
jgi:sensor histidine kinase YesM